MSNFPLAWSVKLIERMHLTYGTKFIQQWDGIDKAELTQFWAEELDGFTADDIRRGLEQCRTKMFPPTLPEFMQMCRPNIDPELAFYDAVKCLHQRSRGEHGDWQHPAVYLAAVHIGQWEIMNRSYQSISRMWSKALSDEIAKGRWDEIPNPTLALAEPRHTEASNEQAGKAMKVVAQAFKPKQVDHKSWARKILGSPKGRSPAVLMMARTAVEETA